MTAYRFGDFELRPRARVLMHHDSLVELTASAFDCLVYLVEHRERAVGKDELIAAVWGSTEVSDNLLAQTVVRLRRSFGDSAEEQRCIKTLPRVGYRWVMDTSLVPDDAQPAQEQSGSAPAAASRRKPPASRRLLRWGAPLLLVIAAVAGYALWRSHARPSSAFGHGTAVVLPAQVHAPQEWSWLRLGLMDLIVGDLRGAKVPVESSQTALDLLDQARQGGRPFESRFVLIRPRIALDDNRWYVQLDATAPDGSALHAEASSDSMLKAARSADAAMLVQMGATASGDVLSDGEKGQYLMRMDAASHAGSMDVLRELIDKAPPEIRLTPEFAYAKAAFHCGQGDDEPCKRELAGLLERLPEDRQPTLRGRALAQQWYVYFREHRYLEGAAAMNEAIRLLKQQNNTAYLAFAHAQRAELLAMAGQLDQAETDFGLARANYALAGDTAGALGIDASLAGLDMRRGHYAQAIPTIQRAYAEYERLGMRSYLPPLLTDLATAQRMLLQHADALATTDRFWPVEQKFPEYPDKVGRDILVFERAAALAGMGRTADASRLLEALIAQVKIPPGEPGLEGTIYALLARLALQRGETAAAQAWAAQALSGQLQERNSDARDHADAWLIQVLAARQANDAATLAQATAAMQAWAGQQPGPDGQPDEWIAVQRLRAQAIQARADGHPDEALARLKLAMGKADRLGVPELVVDTGLAYVSALLENGKTSEANVIGGRLSVWEQDDWRAAWAQACVYRALGRMESARQYQRKARELAGDRVLVAPHVGP